MLKPMFTFISVPDW